MFVSHPSWHVGTSKFEFDLSKSVFDTEEWRNDKLGKEGLLEIEKYLKLNEEDHKAFFNHSHPCQRAILDTTDASIGSRDLPRYHVY